MLAATAGSALIPIDRFAWSGLGAAFLIALSELRKRFFAYRQWICILLAALGAAVAMIGPGA